jgi:F0F1-type ATP synthase epsilon subunit
MPGSAIPKLYVSIKSVDKAIWEGEADWVSSENSHGPFDILPMHANFISIVENKIIKIKTAQKVETFTFPHSIIYAHENKVFVYTNL